MRLLWPTGALIGALGMASADLRSSSTAPPSSTQLERLAWLSGCLEMRKGDLVVEEHRMRPRGSSMLGMSRTTSSKGLMEYELTLIREVDGVLHYEAHPSGQPAAVFTASVVTRDSVVFADPAHDYPQVVGYRRAGADSVTAWIDGLSKRKQRRVEFPYQRVRCGGS